jgi:hypothetical protein
MFSLEEQTNVSLFLLFRFIPYRGELFGLANLLKFKDGTFMEYAPNTVDSRQYGVGVHQKENLLQTVEGMTEEEFAAIGDDDNMFEDLARRTAGWLRFRTICFCTRRNFLTPIIYTGAKDDDENDDDDDVDSVLGGESQVVLDICDRAEVHVDDDETAVGEMADQGPMAVGERGVETSWVPAPVRPKSEDVKPVASAIQANAPPVQSAPLSHPINAVAPAATGARGNIQPRISSSSVAVPPKLEDVKPVASAIQAYAPPVKSAPLSHPTDAVTPAVTGARGNIQPRASSSSVSEHPAAAAAAASNRDDDMIVSNATKKAKPLSATTAAGARKESTSPRNAMLVGKTTNTIQSGKTETTFSAFDLPLPAGAMRKKSKKKRKA